MSQSIKTISPFFNMNLSLKMKPQKKRMYEKENKKKRCLEKENIKMK